MSEHTELKPCPFCEQKVDTPFQNLRDDPEDEDEVIKCWTIRHECQVLGHGFWCEGKTAEECAANWNTRSDPSHAQLVEALEAAKELAEVAKGLTGCRGDDDFVHGVLAKIDAALASANGGSAA